MSSASANASARLILVRCWPPSCSSAPARRRPFPRRSSTAPKFPDFIAPGGPAGDGRQPGGGEPRRAAGRFCRPATCRTAEREFASALKAPPAFYPAETVARLPRARAQGRRRRRCRTSIARSSSTRSTTTRRRSSDAATALLALEPRSRRARRVRGGARRRSVADRARAPRRGAAGSATSSRASAAAREAARGRPARRGGAGLHDARSPARPTARFCIASWPASSGRRATPTPRSSTSARRPRSIPSDAGSLAQIGELLEARGDFDGAREGVRRRARRIEPSADAREASSRTCARKTALARPAGGVPRHRPGARRSRAAIWRR